MLGILIAQIGATPLLYASQAGEVGTATVLIHHGAKVNQQTTVGDWNYMPPLSVVMSKHLTISMFDSVTVDHFTMIPCILLCVYIHVCLMVCYNTLYHFSLSSILLESSFCSVSQNPLSLFC